MGRTVAVFGEPRATVVLITATVSLNGHGIVVAVDGATAAEAATNAEKALAIVASGEVIVMDVLLATSGLGPQLVEPAEGVNCTKHKYVFEELGKLPSRVSHATS